MSRRHRPQRPASSRPLLRALAWALSLVLIGMAVVSAWLWWTYKSPWTYQRPADLPDITAGPHQVFVYGTLRYPLVRWWVMGEQGSPEPAALDDFTRRGLDIVTDSSARVDGLVLEVDGTALADLDRYERLGVRYARTRVTLADGTQAWVYRRLSQPSTQPAQAP